MAQILFIMVLLATIGKSLLFLLRRHVRSFDNLDALQELVLDVYLGGLILYILALIPLHLFSPLVLLLILALSSAFTVAQLVTKLWRKGNWKIDSLIGCKGSQLEQATVLAFFFVSLAIQVVPLTVLRFGSIHDTSLHALFVQLMLENSQIPTTHQPYLPAAIIVPQGAHAIFAFAALVLCITPPLAVFHMTALLNAMTVLAAYHFGKVLDERKYAGLSTAFVFAFVSMWPMHITWGANTFMAGIPFFFIIATLLKQALRMGDVPQKHEILFFLVVGLFLGYLASIHLALFLTLVLAWLIFLFARIRTHWNLVKEIGNVVLFLFTSALMILPFLIRYICYYQLPGQNIGLPLDVVSSEVSLIPLAGLPLTLAQLKDSLLTMPAQYNLSPYLFTRLIVIALIILLPSNLIIRALRKSRLTLAESFGLTLGIASLILYFVAPIPLETGRYAFILYISLMLLLGSFNIWLFTTIRSRVSTSTLIRIKGLVRIRTLKRPALILLIFASLYTPFVYYRIVEDPWRLTIMYRTFAITTDDDYGLMLYMKDNLPRDSIILINPFEPGLFIPALSQKKAVYPLSAYHLSASYGISVMLLTKGMLNYEVFHYLQSQNITHVYIGSKSSPLLKILRRNETLTKWDPLLFLGNPNFKLVKKIGGAYLFEFNLTDRQVVLSDSFEYANLDQGGWRIGLRGDGVGDVVTTSKNAFEGSNSLILRAKSEGEPFWQSVFRRVYVSDPSNVTLSFYLNATIGFGPKDALMLIVSDVYWDKQLYFVTNPRTPIRFTPIYLPSSEGYFEFNLSRLWEGIHNEQLPESFFIQMLNYDVDGVGNVAHIDSIAVGIGKSYLFAPYSATFTYGFEPAGTPLYGWKFCEQGNGTGVAEIPEDRIRKEGILVKAQRSRGWYWSSVYTDVRLFWTTSNVTLSFYINATRGFGASDAFMIIVSDPSWKRQVYFSTWGKMPLPVLPLVLNFNEGHYRFNLSEIWEETHGSPLPNRFFLQILNYDQDGIENVAYVDSVEITVS